jgi:hypothetical protein
MRRGWGSTLVVDELPASADQPARKKTSWSLKTIVEDVAGRPIDELQDPERPQHPYLRVKAAWAPHPNSPRPNAGAPAHTSSSDDQAPELDYDPIDQIYPPLVGETGRSYHGPSSEHHHETLRSVADGAESPSLGNRPHPPGPSRRPERIYLHYLLLHLDRLSDAAMRYLKHAVDEELAHRESGTTAGKSGEPPAPPPPTLPS